MEQSFDFLPNMSSQYAIESMNTPTLPIINQYQVKRHKQTGEIYASAYNDRKPTDIEINTIVKEFCEFYHIQKITFYLVVVKNSGMTYRQLIDAVNNILSTWDDTKFGKPLPAQIVNYDRKVEHLLFTIGEMDHMIRGMIRKFLPNITNSEIADKYNKVKRYYFEYVKDSVGRIIRDNTGGALFIFSKNAETRRNEFLEFING